MRRRARKGGKFALRREGPLLHGAGMLDHVIPILQQLIRELTIALLVLGELFRFFDNDRRRGLGPTAGCPAWSTRPPGAALRPSRGSRPGTQRFEPCALRIEKVVRDLEALLSACVGCAWLGLAKAGLQVRLTAIAYNLRRSATLLTAREV